MKPELDPMMQVRLLRACVEDGDLKAVQRLIADGFAVSHPQVPVQPLALALKLGNPEMVAALLDAGAWLDLKADTQSISWAIRNDISCFIEEAAKRGDIPKSHLDRLLLEAATNGTGEAVALQLLELGANAFFEDAKHQSALDHAITRKRTRVVASIFARCSQGQKNRLLAKYVGYGLTSCVRMLLDAGADPNHSPNGRTLLQIAARGSEEVKRMLRAAKTSASIEDAMGSDEAPAPAAAPSKSSPTL